MSKRPSPAEAIYGRDGPKSGIDDANRKPDAKSTSIDNYFKRYGPAQDKLHSRRGSVSPLLTGRAKQSPTRKR
jgi:hypothetical protein